MLALSGYLFCGLLLGIASVISGRLRPFQAITLVGGGLIGVLVVSLTPYLSAPQDEVLAAISTQSWIPLLFFLALLAAFTYLGLQVLEGDLPEDMVPTLRRCENIVVALGGLTLILALATTQLTLAA